MSLDSSSLASSDTSALSEDEEHHPPDASELFNRFPVPISQPHYYPISVHDWGCSGGFNPLISSTPRLSLVDSLPKTTVVRNPFLPKNVYKRYTNKYNPWPVKLFEHNTSTDEMDKTQRIKSLDVYLQEQLPSEHRRGLLSKMFAFPPERDEAPPPSEEVQNGEFREEPQAEQEKHNQTTQKRFRWGGTKSKKPVPSFKFASTKQVASCELNGSFHCIAFVHGEHRNILVVSVIDFNSANSFVSTCKFDLGRRIHRIQLICYRSRRELVTDAREIYCGILFKNDELFPFSDGPFSNSFENSLKQHYQVQPAIPQWISMRIRHNSEYQQINGQVLQSKRFEYGITDFDFSPRLNLEVLFILSNGELCVWNSCNNENTMRWILTRSDIQELKKAGPPIKSQMAVYPFEPSVAFYTRPQSLYRVDWKRRQPVIQEILTIQHMFPQPQWPVQYFYGVYVNPIINHLIVVVSTFCITLLDQRELNVPRAQWFHHEEVPPGNVQFLQQEEIQLIVTSNNITGEIKLFPFSIETVQDKIMESLAIHSFPMLLIPMKSHQTFRHDLMSDESGRFLIQKIYGITAINHESSEGDNTLILYYVDAFGDLINESHTVIKSKHFAPPAARHNPLKNPQDHVEIVKRLGNPNVMRETIPVPKVYEYIKNTTNEPMTNPSSTEEALAQLNDPVIKATIMEHLVTPRSAKSVQKLLKEEHKIENIARTTIEEFLLGLKDEIHSRTTSGYFCFNSQQFIPGKTVFKSSPFYYDAGIIQASTFARMIDARWQRQKYLHILEEIQAAKEAEEDIEEPQPPSTPISGKSVTPPSVSKAFIAIPSIRTKKSVTPPLDTPTKHSLPSPSAVRMGSPAANKFPASPARKSPMRGISPARSPSPRTPPRMQSFTLPRELPKSPNRPFTPGTERTSYDAPFNPCPPTPLSHSRGASPPSLGIRTPLPPTPIRFVLNSGSFTWGSKEIDLQDGDPLTRALEKESLSQVQQQFNSQLAKGTATPPPSGDQITPETPKTPRFPPRTPPPPTPQSVFGQMSQQAFLPPEAFLVASPFARGRSSQTSSPAASVASSSLKPTLSLPSFDPNSQASIDQFLAENDEDEDIMVEGMTPKKKRGRSFEDELLETTLQSSKKRQKSGEKSRRRSATNSPAASQDQGSAPSQDQRIGDSTFALQSLASESKTFGEKGASRFDSPSVFSKQTSRVSKPSETVVPDSQDSLGLFPISVTSNRSTSTRVIPDSQEANENEGFFPTEPTYQKSAPSPKATQTLPTLFPLMASQDQIDPFSQSLEEASQTPSVFQGLFPSAFATKSPNRAVVPSLNLSSSASLEPKKNVFSDSDDSPPGSQQNPKTPTANQRAMTGLSTPSGFSVSKSLGSPMVTPSIPMTPPTQSPPPLISTSTQKASIPTLLSSLKPTKASKNKGKRAMTGLSTPSSFSVSESLGSPMVTPSIPMTPPTQSPPPLISTSTAKASIPTLLSSAKPTKASKKKGKVISTPLVTPKLSASKAVTTPAMVMIPTPVSPPKSTSVVDSTTLAKPNNSSSTVTIPNVSTPKSKSTSTAVEPSTPSTSKKVSSPTVTMPFFPMPFSTSAPTVPTTSVAPTPTSRVDAPAVTSKSTPSLPQITSLSKSTKTVTKTPIVVTPALTAPKSTTSSTPTPFMHRTHDLLETETTPSTTNVETPMDIDPLSEVLDEPTPQRPRQQQLVLPSVESRNLTPFPKVRGNKTNPLKPTFTTPSTTSPQPPSVPVEPSVFHKDTKKSLLSSKKNIVPLVKTEKASQEADLVESDAGSSVRKSTRLAQRDQDLLAKQTKKSRLQQEKSQNK